MRQNPDALELASLLCSRVCHDVVNPVGAIINGLEVLDDGDDPELRDIAFDLIRKSAEQASAKLQFARLAFGAASSAGATIDLGDAEMVAGQIIDKDKISLDWRLPRVSVPKDQAKLVLNLMLTGIATIPRGGALTVDGEIDGDRLTGIVVRSTGSYSRIPDEVERFVTRRGTWEDVSSHQIQPYFTGLIAETVGMSVTFDWTGEVISVIAKEDGVATEQAADAAMTAGSGTQVPPSVPAESQGRPGDDVISFVNSRAGGS